ncbi:unnamed protein product [Symbiodinium sp. CCMP2456]|nr:unnamed protein product [Symbiodinium sp. CCMP2456]
MAALRLLRLKAWLRIPSGCGFASLAPKLPRHRSPTARRKPKATEEGADEQAEAGRLPEWLFEDRPVWLQALLVFLREPDLVMVRLGGGGKRMGRRPAAGSLPELKELLLPEDQLRDWARAELQEAADSGRKVRAVAVLATEADQAADAVEVLRSMGFKRVANLRTKAFLQQLQSLPLSE